MTNFEKGSKIHKMATGGSDLTSDEILNIKCCVCTEDNRNREAEKYCIDCKDYFCSSCVGIHTKISSMKAHKLMDKNAFNSMGPDTSLPSYPTQRCPQHQTELVNMYCKDHDEVACASCIALSLSHKSCKNIVSIIEEIDSLYQNKSLGELRQKFIEAKKHLEEIKTTKETKIQDLKAALITEIESVKAFRQELQTMLDNIEEETVEELKRETNRIEESLLKDIAEIESLLSSIKEAAHHLKKSEGNMAQEFVCVKSSKKFTERGEELRKTQLQRTDETVSFAPDQSIKEYLLNNKRLGKITVKKLALKLANTSKDSLYKVKKQREIDVKLDNDKADCSIWGSCLTEDGSVLLADNNNKKLKRMNMSTYKVNDYIELQASPGAVCTISKDKAAVTLNNKTVQFLSLRDKITAMRALTMNHKCHGLAYQDKKLFISDHESSVYIYDMNGQEQQRITAEVLSDDIWIGNQNIVFNASGDRFFVSHWQNGVVVFDSFGNYISTMCVQNTSQNSGYRGICTDGENIFVSFYWSNNIIQFGHDLKLLGEIGKVEKPLSLCFDREKMRLIVSIDGKNSVTILELE